MRRRTNKDFLFDGPGYYVDTTGERWLVGEDPDGDLVGLNPLHRDPTVIFWDPSGRFFGAKGEAARDLVGPVIERKRA